MIRALRTADIDRVSEIWLRSNTEVHDYVPARYWQDVLEPVKGMLAQGEVYVFEGPEGRIEGFIGLEGEHIEGIFVGEGRAVRGDRAAADGPCEGPESAAEPERVSEERACGQVL